MDIRKAKMEDIDQALQLVDAAKAYFKANGINQWQDGYPNKESLMHDIEQEKGFVLCDENHVIGYCYGAYEHEANYDHIENGQWLTNSEQYFVIHRVVISDVYKGRGLAAMFINYFIDICHRFLAKNGFKQCGRIYLANGDPRIGYEFVLD